jgi:hypothetical protein
LKKRALARIIRGMRAIPSLLSTLRRPRPVALARVVRVEPRLAARLSIYRNDHGTLACLGRAR